VKSIPGSHTGDIDGHDAAILHTTYGFPIDLTRQMAAELGMTVDEREYLQAIEEHRRISRKGQKSIVITAVRGEVPKTDDAPKFGPLTGQGTVLGWVKDSVAVREGILQEDDEVGLLLDRTNFYAEQGGQVGDSGTLRTPTGTFEVVDTHKFGDAILHLGRVVSGIFEVGQPATLEVGGSRPHTMRNHTATHLLNWALREVLGDHIDQKGSLVDADKTRFDFTHDKPLSSEEVSRIERLVNEKIHADLPVSATIMKLADANKLPGLRAVFGEKYPDPVRVVVIGADSPDKADLTHSIEFCGGTHLSRTSQAGFFEIVSQEGVAKGVRRVTAVTGRGAVEAVQKLTGVVNGLTGALNCKPDEVLARVVALQDEVKALRTQLKKGAAGDLNSAGDALFASAKAVGGARVIVGEVPAAGVEQIRTQLDRLRQKAGTSVVLVGWADEGKVGFMSAVTDDLTAKVQAGKLVGEVAKVCGGKGGGRPDMAQAGGSDPAKLAEALALGAKLIGEKLEA
jgi:alanyl-tRNA synthetase